MKGRTIHYFVATCCALAALVIPTQAQQAATPSITTKLDLPYVSRYVWRGTVPNADPAFQPSLTLTHKSGVSLNLWESMDTTSINKEQGHATEIDYTLNYAWTAGKLGMNAGLIDYTFPNTKFPPTSEVYASTCFGGKFSPSLSVNYDFKEANGYYASFTTGYACTMPWNKDAPTNANLSARLSFASANYNQLYFGAAKNAFTDLLLSASVPFTMAKTVTLTPALNYSTVLDGALRDGVAHPDNFFTSLTASVAF